MTFPTLTEVTEEVWAHVKALRGWGIEEGDIRLQVYEDGGWYFHTGDSSYDQDHRGYWGCSSVSRTTTKTECREIARELIEQAKDQKAESAE